MRLLQQLCKEIKTLVSPAKAESSAWFFKTGKGGYAENDVFIGLSVPQMRKLAIKYAVLSLPELASLLASKIHEQRFIALEILVFRFERATQPEKIRIAKFYLKHLDAVDNWDLVDTSAPYISGVYFYDLHFGWPILEKLAKSVNIWHRRVAIVSTYYFIRQGRFTETFRLSQMFLSDKHDLIHKATGWMLREAGKRDMPALLRFLEKHRKQMPRTMLRYAIERLPAGLRKKFLAK